MFLSKVFLVPWKTEYLAVDWEAHLSNLMNSKANGAEILMMPKEKQVSVLERQMEMGKASELHKAAWDGERRTNGYGGRINCSCLQLASESAASWKVNSPWGKAMLFSCTPFQAYKKADGWRDCFLLLLFLTERRWITWGSWWSWYCCPRSALGFPRDWLHGSGQLQADFVI